MILDGASRRNLELDINLAGGRENTLQSVVDRCQTAMGSRLLTRWLNRPLRDRRYLEARQESIACLAGALSLRNPAAAAKEIGDRAHSGANRPAQRRPRDLARLRDALLALPGLQMAMAELEAPHLHQPGRASSTYPELAALLAAIIDNPPAVIRDGGVLKTATTPSWTSCSAQRKRRQYLMDLETREKARTGWPTSRSVTTGARLFYRTAEQAG